MLDMFNHSLHYKEKPIGEGELQLLLANLSVDCRFRYITHVSKSQPIILLLKKEPAVLDDDQQKKKIPT